uniref:proline--tRNA ligase n=1 Tax=Polytomella parva TaxID=51329 RepID=A0A7S0V630_9CHLO|mmetsp:Transcript_28833/g.52958  ORF Transcript_28833/g.52958 Transcript_28833/m.52958 type:complete len:548 (+) Transcript_28833:42-1685(+)
MRSAAQSFKTFSFGLLKGLNNTQLKVNITFPPCYQFALKSTKSKMAPKESKKETKKETKLGLAAKKGDNFSDWYTELVVASELISYYDVSGCYILRPSAYAMWEVIQSWFDKEIKASGVKNAYFPLFITEDVLNTEKDHVEGFAPEVAWVTKAGNTPMEKPIAIRPTSETVMYPYYSQWIRSHRDLPLRLNQWTNVVRWEFKYPTPFIRSREFLWQEGHTAFATQAEAEAEVLEILELYRQVYEDLLAVPVVKGRKSRKEQFAGALYTTTVEAFIPETGKAIQGATSHCLGQNFSKMFNIEYESEDKSKQLVWQNSWGITTRSIGVMLMTHSDDKGLVLPPKVAETQAVIIPIPRNNTPKEVQEKMLAKITEIKSQLEKAGVRTITDTRENYTPGWKFNHHELHGVCLRIEVGPKDMENESVVVCRRDTGDKQFISWADVAEKIPALLVTMQEEMLGAARLKHKACMEVVSTWDEFMTAINNKHMALAPWADEVEVEEDVKKRSAVGKLTGAKTLCIPFEQPELPEGAVCFASGKPAKNWALWGRSY